MLKQLLLSTTTVIKLYLKRQSKMIAPSLCTRAQTLWLSAVKVLTTWRLYKMQITSSADAKRG